MTVVGSHKVLGLTGGSFGDLVASDEVGGQVELCGVAARMAIGAAIGRRSACCFGHDFVALLVHGLAGYDAMMIMSVGSWISALSTMIAPRVSQKVNMERNRGAQLLSFGR